MNNRLGNKWHAFSAGTKPAGFVDPLTIAVLKEIGIDHHGDPKHIDQFFSDDFALVISVCDSDSEECPVWLGKGILIHHSFPDPAKATGSKEDVTNVFRIVRDAIALEIPEILELTAS